MKYKLTSHDRMVGYQKRKFRQVLHDEQCRPILEALANPKGGGHIAVALARLKSANIPAPGGGNWHRRAVYRIAERLGINLLSGRAFGEFPCCAQCGKQVGRVYPDSFCWGCEQREQKRRGRAVVRRLEMEELDEARDELVALEARIRRLETGGGAVTRSRAHPMPQQRFGRQIKPRKA